MSEDKTLVQNHIHAYFTEESFEIKSTNTAELSADELKLYELYLHDKGSFVLDLAFSESTELSASVAYLRYISQKYVSTIINDPNFNLLEAPTEIRLSDAATESLVRNTPYVLGSQFINTAWVQAQIKLLNQAFISACTSAGKSPRVFLASRSPNLVIPSRVYFHLVENKQRDQYPFAFLATYTVRINGSASHAPLKNALSEMKSKRELSGLIKSINEISEHSSFIKHLLDSGDIFYPIKFSDDEAYCFLKEVSLYEHYGVICRIPAWYNDSSNSIKVDLNEKKQYQQFFFNKSIINSFTPQMIYHGIPISVEEARQMLSRKEGLEQIKGRWVENNHQQLEEMLEEYEALVGGGTTILDIIRNKSGFVRSSRSSVKIDFSREDFVEQFFKDAITSVETVPVPEAFSKILRHYQKDAFDWLYALKRLGMGACLADDMGLGKTVEVLAFLKKLQNEGASHVLIIVPATLVDNWRHEVAKFSPDMDPFVLRGYNEPTGTATFSYLTICTYQTAIKSDYISRVKWDAVILDEAQAIKNFYTAQAKKVKSLSADMRIAMTGTPIENNLVELWSIFDFINPGLLGNRQEFIALYKRLKARPDGYRDLKTLINPFVLRRVKNDKAIISDLPEKNEVDVTITLTKEQIVLYKKVVDAMNASIHRLHDRREEKIIVMTSLMKLKQVCNHPSQYYGDSYYDPQLSGKFVELKRICETISEKNEKVLVFTQFKEIIPALNELLEGVFFQKGFCIDGNTSMKKRDEYVQSFQAGKAPYMILSLKTAGVGLNLTAAQNVIHFDRWWNPAVENQATDRTYRIGQQNNVTVYKFISANTIEEVISNMLVSKQALADLMINDLDGNILSKLSTEELLTAAKYGGFTEDE